MNHLLQCQCGTVRGYVGAGATNRGVCYCKDCRAFARFVGPGSILDSQGGTYVVQTVQSNVTITAGHDRLACIRLTDRGLLRWYARCCKTPIGNTPPDYRLSVVGLVQACLEHGSGPRIEESFGPVRMAVHTKSALGGRKPRSYGLLRGLFRILAMVVRARVSGDYRRTPFFSSNDGAPIAPPKVLTAHEREALRDAPT